MKICMLAYSFYENDNRVMRYAEALAKRGDLVSVIALRKSDQKNFERMRKVNVYRIQEIKGIEKSKLIHLYRLLKFFLKSALYLTRTHLKARYDIIHVHSVPDFEVFAALIPKLMGAKTILDIHDPVPDLFAAKFGSEKSILYIKLLILCEKLSTRFADHVITVTDYWREVISKRSNVHGEKFSVIENFPDTEIFNRHLFKSREKSDEHFTLLFPGTMQKHCGLDAAIKAVDLLKRGIPLIRFLIYGTGSEYHHLKSMVKDRSLDGTVFFKKAVPIEQLPRIMSEAHVGIALLSPNSNYSQQALSVKLFEFLAMELPAIATKTKALDHYLDDSVAMFTKTNDPIEVANHIRELYLNPGKRNTLIKNGLNWIKKHNWEVKKKDYYQIIDHLLD